MAGFPIELLNSVRCSVDGGVLGLGPDAVRSADGTQVLQAFLHCDTCDALARIEDGILNLTIGTRQDAESAHEQRLRDVEYTGYQSNAGEDGWQDHDEMEILPTLEALSLRPGAVILELGCGDGRYTLELARGRVVLAVDFSIVALRHLRERLRSADRVGLVLGDVTQLHLASGTFDAALCTLMSNLPSASHRQAVYRAASTGIRKDGRFAFSAHHQGLRQILSGEKKEGRYQEGGIYRYHMTVAECRRELQPYFRRVHARPIQVFVPLGRTLGLPVVRISRMLEVLPVANFLGNLVLCVAQDPV